MFSGIRFLYIFFLRFFGTIVGGPVQISAASKFALTTYVSQHARVRDKGSSGRKTQIAARGGHLRLDDTRRNSNCTNRRGSARHVYDSRPFIRTCTRIDVVGRNYGAACARCRPLSPVPRPPRCRRARTHIRMHARELALAKNRIARHN